jgi:hypothetical protein
MAADGPGDKLALGSAIAGGAIVAALIEALLDKGILSVEESRTVLDHALRRLPPGGQRRSRSRRPHYKIDARSILVSPRDAINIRNASAPTSLRLS